HQQPQHWRADQPSTAADWRKLNPAPIDFKAATTGYRRVVDGPPAQVHSSQMPQRPQSQPGLASQASQQRQPPMQMQAAPFQMCSGGGSSSSATHRVKRRVPQKPRRTHHADFSDDEVISETCFFDNMDHQKDLLVLAISHIVHRVRPRTGEPPLDQEWNWNEGFGDPEFWAMFREDALQQAERHRQPKQVAEFVLTIMDTGYFEVSELIVCLIYLKRLETSLPIHALSWRKMFLTALLLADKFLMDKPVKNTDLLGLANSLQDSAGSTMDIKAATFYDLELKFLSWMGLNISVSREAFKNFCKLDLLQKGTLDPDVKEEVFHKHPYITTPAFHGEEETPVESRVPA
ncbi:unnamed protein product, partial [Polarella glacialis]